MKLQFKLQLVRRLAVSERRSAMFGTGLRRARVERGILRTGRSAAPIRWQDAVVLLSLLVSTTVAQLDMLPPEQSPAVFGGEAHAVHIILRNTGERPIETSLKSRLFQHSSTTRMPVGEAEPWKHLTVLGGQTVLESARLKFPGVRAITRFEVRWMDAADKLVGQTLVTVYPTNLLQEFAEIAGEKPPGVFDPHEQLTPSLRVLQVAFVDLTEGERLDTWCGRLAILGPFNVQQTPPRDLQKRAARLAARGVAVVMLAPTHERADSAVRASNPLRSAVVVRPIGIGRVVTAAGELVAGLDIQPLAQEKLLELARLAVAPNLPLTETEP